MEKLITTLLLMLPAMAGAQNYQNMGEADMQKMMQKMQACMAEIDLSEMEEFEQRANQMQAKVDALCASGKRDEAQEEGIAFAREVSSNESMKKMQTCSKMMQGAMPGMPTTRQEAADMVGNRHICDN